MVNGNPAAQRLDQGTKQRKTVRDDGSGNCNEQAALGLERNGQCQDYAIAKFLLLRALGVSDDAMRLVVLRDVRRQVDHAVLVVTVGGQSLMLDNLASRVVSAASNPNYRAYYSINEAGWWMYLPNPLTPQTLSGQVASR